MQHKILSGIITAFVIFSVATTALAHVVVRPDEANVGKFVTFTMSVPSEKPIATLAMRLVLPDGLNYVTPTVKPGWTVEVKKDGEKPTEILWKGGSVPAGMRDDFSFSAQVPTSATTLQWKAYQTYADASVVSWEQDPNQPVPTDGSGKMDFSKMGPFSVTKVVNDLVLAANQPTETPKVSSFDARVNVALVLSVLAFVIALSGKRRKSE